MRQIAYPAALGSCVLGAGSAPVRAAEWSITPLYSSSVDYDSNRLLAAKAKGSEAAVLSIDLKLKRALEGLELTFEPRYTFRRFTDGKLGNGDDRGVSAGMNWAAERSTLNLTTSYLDQSTLVTEVLETGLIDGDTHRRAAQAGGTWSWNQTERRALVTQLSYLSVSYYGLNKALLPGYRYPSASVGEQFTFSERGTFTLSAFGSRLQSDTAADSSHETGLQVEVVYAVSEQTKVDASLGKSKRVLTGASSGGTDIGLTLDHSLFLGGLRFSYKRSLVPYGFGFLSEQQQYTASFTRPLTPYLDCNLSFYRTQANDTAVLLRLDRRYYNASSIVFKWHPVETWALSTELSNIHSQTADVFAQGVDRWRGSLTLTWSPFPRSRSW